MLSKTKISSYFLKRLSSVKRKALVCQMGSARWGAGNSGLFPRLFDYPVFEFVSKKILKNIYISLMKWQFICFHWQSNDNHGHGAKLLAYQGCSHASIQFWWRDWHSRNYCDGRNEGKESLYPSLEEG